MACIDSKGDSIASARATLEATSDAGTPEEVSGLSGVPLSLARYMLRELQSAGLVALSEGRYSLTDSGRARLEPLAR